MSKSAASVRQTLIRFINEYHPAKLTSDIESAFIENNIVRLLTHNDELMHIITEQHHSFLGIIDKFISK